MSLSYLVLICLVLMLGPIFCAWIYNEWRRQRRERAAFRHVVRCVLCGFEFQDPSGAPVAHCPRCGGANERFPLSRL